MAQSYEIQYMLSLKAQVDKQIKDLSKVINGIGTEASKSESKTKSFSDQVKNLDANAKTTSQGVSALTSTLGAFGVVIGARAVLDFAYSIVQAGAEIETLTNQFKPLLGSAEAAKQRLVELQAFAANTPFELPEIANASRILQSLTQGALATGEGLTMVGDAAATSGTDFENLAIHIGRAYSGLQSNRAIGESLARLQELGLLSGEVRNKIELLQSQAKGKEAWAVLQEELKKSQGAMDDLAQTFDGKVSTLSDTWTEFMVVISDTGGLSLAKGAVDLLTTSIQFWSDAMKETPPPTKIIAGVEELQRAQKEVLRTERQLNTELENRNRTDKVEYWKAQVAIAKENVKLKTDELNATRHLNEEAQKASEDEAKRQKEAEDQIAKREEMAKSRLEIEQTINAALLSASRIHEEAGKTADEVEILRIENKYKDLIEKAKNHRDMVAKLESARGTEIDDVKTAQEKEKKDESDKIQQDKDEKALELRQTYLDEYALLDMEAEEVEKERLNQKYDRELQQLIDARLSTLEVEAVHQAQLTAIEEKYSKQRIKQAEIETEQKTQAILTFARGFSSLLGQMSSDNKKAARLNQVVAIGEATVNTYNAANKALASAPPPFNFIAMAGVIAAGIANVATISTQKFANGGIVGGTSYQGDNVPVNVNSREMILNGGQQKRLFEIANGRGSTTNRSSVNVQGGAISVSVGNGADSQMVEKAISNALYQSNIELARMIRENQEFGVTA